MERPFDRRNQLLMAGVVALAGFAFAGCIAASHGPTTPVDETAVARKLYVAKCAKCHKFYDPAKYSDEQWQIWMSKMSKKAKLKPAQEELLARYIENTFRHPNQIKPN